MKITQALALCPATTYCVEWKLLKMIAQRPERMKYASLLNRSR